MTSSEDPYQPPRRPPEQGVAAPIADRAVGIMNARQAIQHSPLCTIDPRVPPDDQQVCQGILVLQHPADLAGFIRIPAKEMPGDLAKPTNGQVCAADNSPSREGIVFPPFQ